MRKLSVGAGVIALLAMGLSANTREIETADVIYFGGEIVTISDAKPTVEAVAVKEGKIVATGLLDEVAAANKGDLTKLVNLAGIQCSPALSIHTAILSMAWQWRIRRM